MERQQRFLALGGFGGGVLIAAGSLSPWFSLFAGLQPYAGTVGPYGRVLLAIGVIVCVASAVLLWRPHLLSRRRLAAIVGGTGAASLAFAIWIAYGLQQKMRELEASPMLVAEHGRGLPMIIAGALVLTVAALVAAPSVRSATGMRLDRDRMSGHPDHPSLLPSRAR